VPRSAGPFGYATAAFSPGGRLIAAAVGQPSGNADPAELFDVTDSRRPASVGLVGEHTGSIAFSPDGHFLATVSYAGLTQLWNIADARHPALLSNLAGDPQASCGSARTAEPLRWATAAPCASGTWPTLGTHEPGDPRRPTHLRHQYAHPDGQ
jgi:WD40 repeat protein